MNAARLLSNLTGQGFALSIEGERLIVSPSARLSETARAEIRTHKAEILSLLAANDPEPVKIYRLLLVTRETGEAFTLSRNPPATLAEIERDYPGCTVAPVSAPPPAAALEGENLKIAYSLLRHWQEADIETGEQWLDGLARDPVMLEQMLDEALRLGLAVPAPAPPPTPEQPEIPRQMAVCARCRHFESDPINPSGGLGRCRADAPASRKAGSCWPWADAEILCNQFDEVNR